MPHIPITDGLTIASEGFEPYNMSVVHHILRNIYQRTNLTGNYTNRILPHINLVHWESYPLCSSCGDQRVIFLTTNADYWCQWIYQFAHEICHHVIDGTMSGELRGQIWFEEMLCETNSLYQLLQTLHIDCNQNQQLYLYAPSVRDYLNALIGSNQDLKLELQENEGVQQWLPLLYEPQYHREYYNAIACRILPLFVENPHLWGILSHIGDSRSYQTLQDLFSHLRDSADESYRASLEKLIDFLLP